MKSTFFAIGLLVPSLAAAQTLLKPPPTVTSCPDKVAVTGFTVTPTAPAIGAPVTVTMSVRNNCSTPLDIPWRIAKNSSVLAQGTLYGSPAGGTQTVKATWAAVSGNHHFYGDADPNNVLADGTRGNNIGAYDVAVPDPPQKLSYSQARIYGASFPLNGDQPLCKVINEDVEGYIHMGVACGPPFLQYGTASGIKAAPEAFAKFQLRNGWVIDRWEFLGQTGCDNIDSQWKWVSGAPGPPKADQSDPFMKLHFWANGGGVCTVKMNIWVKGPPGTNPYY